MGSTSADHRQFSHRAPRHFPRHRADPVGLGNHRRMGRVVRGLWRLLVACALLLLAGLTVVLMWCYGLAFSYLAESSATTKDEVESCVFRWLEGLFFGWGKAYALKYLKARWRDVTTLCRTRTPRRKATRPEPRHRV